MKFVLYICVEEGVSPTPEQRQAMPEAVEEWIAETEGNGVRLGGWQMAPPAEAAVLRVRDGQLHRSEGSFADPARRVAGLNLLECASLDEAVEVAGRHPVATFGAVEVRALED